MYKCKYCKKSELKGYYRCKIYGKIMRNKCTNFLHPKCRSFELSPFDRLRDWVNDKFDY